MHTRAQKLSNLLQQYAAQIFKSQKTASTKPMLVEVSLFTGLPPLNIRSVSHVLYTTWKTREKRDRRV